MPGANKQTAQTVYYKTSRIFLFLVRKIKSNSESRKKERNKERKEGRKEGRKNKRLKGKGKYENLTGSSILPTTMTSKGQVGLVSYLLPLRGAELNKSYHVDTLLLNRLLTYLLTYLLRGVGMAGIAQW